MRIKLECEYAGERFSGWQRQPNLSTVQGELEQALEIVLRSRAKKEGIEIAEFPHLVGSGRTDAGVHARGQAASFEWPAILSFDAPALLASLNALTPPQLVVRSLAPAPPNFDARHAPHLKCYTYRMLLRSFSAGYYLNRAWCVPSDLDIGAMAKAARLLRGQHDFSAFRSQDCTAATTVRTLLLSELSRPSADELLYVAHGKGFLKNMIRIIVGTLVDVGSRKIAPQDVEGILQSKDRTQAGITAPPQGLTLEWVRYLGESEKLPWEEDER